MNTVYFRLTEDVRSGGCLSVYLTAGVYTADMAVLPLRWIAALLEYTDQFWLEDDEHAFRLSTETDGGWVRMIDLDEFLWIKLTAKELVPS